MNDEDTPIEYVPHAAFQRHVQREERFFQYLTALLTLILLLEGVILWRL